MSKWKTFPHDVPNNLEVVWVRVKYYYSTPFLATYINVEEEFISIDNLITYPVWCIARWKHQ